MASETFGLDIARFVEKAKVAPEQVVRKIGLDIATDIVMKSPVAEPSKWKNPDPSYVGGRFRANWNVAFGRIDTLTTPSTDRGGSKTIERIRIQLNGWKPEAGAIYLTNSLPYAIPLEYGWSDQAPVGVVRITVTQFQTYVNAAVAELPK